jgi:hypothetical protein
LFEIFFWGGGGFGSIIFGTGFGFSTNFWVGLLMRFLLGSFNGILGTAKVRI